MTEAAPTLETLDVPKGMDNIQHNNFVTKVLLAQFVFVAYFLVERYYLQSNGTILQDVGTCNSERDF
jgi:hypothetical protein